MAVGTSYKMAVEAPTKWPWISNSFHRLYPQVQHTRGIHFTRPSAYLFRTGGRLFTRRIPFPSMVYLASL